MSQITNFFNQFSSTIFVSSYTAVTDAGNSSPYMQKIRITETL